MSKTLHRNINMAWQALVNHCIENERLFGGDALVSVGRFAQIANISVPTARKYLSIARENGVAEIAVKSRGLYWIKIGEAKGGAR